LPGIGSFEAEIFVQMQKKCRLSVQVEAIFDIRTSEEWSVALTGEHNGVNLGNVLYVVIGDGMKIFR
jgi:hypothetical protein